MAHKKAGGSTSLGRDSVSKRLGVKIFGDQRVGKGEIIVRQHGNKFHAGDNVKTAGDSTLYSMVDGIVKFQEKMLRKFHGNLRSTRVVSVTPLARTEPKPSSALLRVANAAKTTATAKPATKKAPAKTEAKVEAEVIAPAPVEA
ncbi:MAG TPA: 50S ribosomal protein L27 [Patescibacteria group bacterium]|jgi:large subunit ribosomal protein L27|nr:50S ribosomal protein L27 [Patescibacteria group bacterium]